VLQGGDDAKEIMTDELWIWWGRWSRRQWKGQGKMNGFGVKEILALFSVFWKMVLLKFEWMG